MPDSHRHAGFSLVELMVVLAIIGILMGIAIPNFNRGAVSLLATAEQLQADVRMARGNAMGRNVRYQITLHSSSYEITRLRLDTVDQIWKPDPLHGTQTIELPPQIAITVGVGKTFTFTSRGVLARNVDVTSALPVQIEIHDNHTNGSQTINVWPSGQVEDV